MLALAFFKWWYGLGWQHLVARQRDWLATMAERFSVGILLRTLFSPWKRIISYGDRSIVEQMRSLVDNGVSRLVGFTVRVIVLVAALFVLTAGLVFSVAMVMFWPIVPPVSFALIIFGVMSL